MPGLALAVMLAVLLAPRVMAPDIATLPPVIFIVVLPPLIVWVVAVPTVLMVNVCVPKVIVPAAAV